MSEHIILYITFPTSEQAETIAELFIKQKLIACANIMPPHKAIYEWEDKICNENEVVLLAKTREDKFEEIKTLTEQNHPYDLPCIVCVEISDANKDFLEWIDRSLK